MFFDVLYQVRIQPARAAVLAGGRFAGAGLAAAFDGVTNTVGSASTTLVAGTVLDAYIGKDWGLGTSKTVTGFKIWGASSEGFIDVITYPSVTISIYGSNTAPTGPATGTLLGSAVAVTNAPNIVVSVLSGLTTTTAYRYHWLRILNGGAAANIFAAEVEFFEASIAPDMTLQSNADTALAQPDNVFAVLRQQDVDAVTLNTDLTIEASRDGGTTWTAITLAEAATLSPDRILTGSADISAQPVGTAMKWRLKTLNAKSQKIHAVGLEWS